MISKCDRGPEWLWRVLTNERDDKSTLGYIVYSQPPTLHLGYCSLLISQGYGLRLYVASQTFYIGSWHNGSRQRGTMYNQHGHIIYEGEWAYEVYHGFGILRDDDGKIIHEGQWNQGKPVVQ